MGAGRGWNLKRGRACDTVQMVLTRGDRRFCCIAFRASAVGMLVQSQLLMTITKKMKDSVQIFFLLVVILCRHSYAQADTNLIEKEYAALATEEKTTFERTGFGGSKPFVGHPKLTSEYLQSLRSFFQPKKTTVVEAKLWFRKKGIAVGFESYNGCTAEVTASGVLHYSRYYSLMQKIDSNTWFIFFFGGKDDLFNEAYLLRKADNLRVNGIPEFAPLRWSERVIPKGREPSNVEKSPQTGTNDTSKCEAPAIGERDLEVILKPEI